jgi:hypothetical protein
MKIKENILNKRNLGYIVTFGSEFLIMLISISLFKLFGKYFSVIDFAEFTISKRLNSFLIPLLFFGLGVSLPKYLSVAAPQKQLQIYYSALLIISTLFFVRYIFQYFCNLKTFSILL